MNPVVVQRIMGHKDIKVTLNTYTSVLNKYKTEEFNKVALYYLEQNIRELPETTQDTNEITLVSSDYTINEKEHNNISIEEIMNCYKYTEEQILALFDSKEEMEQEEEKADIIWKQILEKQKQICD
jgi:TRAP-type mannitol/chloroaromatic compound transport system substrate-binding protein